MSIPANVHLHFADDPYAVYGAPCVHEHYAQAAISIPLVVADTYHEHHAERGFSLKKDFDDRIMHYADSAIVSVYLSPADSFIYHDDVPPWGEPPPPTLLVVSDGFSYHDAQGFALIYDDPPALVIPSNVIYQQSDHLFVDVTFVPQLVGNLRHPVFGFNYRLDNIRGNLSHPSFSLSATVDLANMLTGEFKHPSFTMSAAVSVSVSVRGNLEHPSFSLSGRANVSNSVAATLALPSFSMTSVIAENPTVTATLAMPSFTMRAVVMVEDEDELILTHNRRSANWEAFA